MPHAPDNPHRQLPPVNDILQHPAIVELIARRGRDTVLQWARDALTEVRRRLSDGPVPTDRGDFLESIVQIVQSHSENESTLRLGKVINATGVILHTSLGRAPLSAAAIAAIQEAAGACNLEVDLDSGDRRYRGYQLQSAWKQLTGCEDALVVNNNAAATVLALQALCAGREVVISRGQLIEIGGSFRLPDIFVESGAALREIGTTNRTHLADYEKAIGPHTAAILRVHPSNYRIEGFAETPETQALADLAHSRGLICIDDIGSGCLVDVTQFGLPAEPTFQQSLAAGADVVLGSGDKLLGGPQCGILLGRAELIARLREHPLARAFRVDKLTLAALQATLDAYLRDTALQEIPTLSLLATSADDLFRRAESIAAQLASSQVTVARDTSPVGGGSLPGASLPTAVLKLRHAAASAEELARRLRVADPRVYGRVQQNEVILDLRSVIPADDGELVKALTALFAGI